MQQIGDNLKNPNSFVMLIAKDRIVRNELIVKTILEQQIKRTQNHTVSNRRN